MALGWWKTENGAFYNPDRLLAVYVAQEGELWVIKAGPGAGIGGDIQLSGSWPTRDDALQAAARLVHAFDPATL